MIGVSTAVRRGEAVLLVKRAKPPFAWAFPGGHLEFGERLADGAAREVFEETGLEVEIGEVIDRAEIFLKDDSGALVRHFVLFVFAGRYLSGEAAPADDATDIAWATRESLSTYDLTPDAARIAARLLADAPPSAI